MNLRDTLKTLKEKMDSVEYLSYLETKKREAELTGNADDLTAIQEALNELELESDKKIEEFGTEVKDKLKEVFSVLGLDKIFEIVETDEKENKKEEVLEINAKKIRKFEDLLEILSNNIEKLQKKYTIIIIDTFMEILYYIDYNESNLIFNTFIERLLLEKGNREEEIKIYGIVN